MPLESLQPKKRIDVRGVLTTAPERVQTDELNPQNEIEWDKMHEYLKKKHVEDYSKKMTYYNIMKFFPEKRAEFKIPYRFLKVNVEQLKSEIESNFPQSIDWVSLGDRVEKIRVLAPEKLNEIDLTPYSALKSALELAANGEKWEQYFDLLGAAKYIYPEEATPDDYQQKALEVYAKKIIEASKISTMTTISQLIKGRILFPELTKPGDAKIDIKKMSRLIGSLKRQDRQNGNPKRL